MRDTEHESKNLQARYGNAPDAFRDHVFETLGQLEEGKAMKRFTIRTALLTALILCLLAGAALAIGNQLGVLGFLEKNGELSADAKETIQTEFEQEGGDMEHISVRVRDAVSDGKTLFLVMEYKAKDPKDALLDSMDSIDPEDAEMFAEWSIHRDPDSYPNWDDISPEQTIRYLGNGVAINVIEGEDGSSLIPESGYNWRYEGTDTILYNIMIDLQRLENPQEELKILSKSVEVEEVPVAKEDWPENADPLLYSTWKTIGESEVTVRVRAGTMPQQRATAAAELPVRFCGMDIEQLEVTLTPLALYVGGVNKIVEEDVPFWYEYHDTNGEPFTRLAYVLVPESEAGKAPVRDQGKFREMIYASPGEMPEALVLHARPGFDLDPSATPELPDDLTIKLTPVE